ncbi:hypothetical protein, conserved [Plasmodium gonderi]|uniref:Uncharacterized protein n=1 Tax=Plasmodium gonderi TaxID=77519 RepID=A0A1Y1JSH8_PLAGO|nr:hypothetical protein, conserved [Plasmodium gonderi]GAW82924.1 hypothetical protein, conserved [Plasmodium gonderi]
MSVKKGDINMEEYTESVKNNDKRGDINGEIGTCPRREAKVEEKNFNTSNNCTLENTRNMVKTYIDDYLKRLYFYKDDPKFRESPTMCLEGTEEIENYMIKEKTFVTTYYQYIEIYNNTTNIEEHLEKEEIVYVEMAKYGVTKYKPYIVTKNNKKYIEIPNEEKIKNPIYATVNVPYIIPHLVENETLVVLKKIVQPKIQISNEELQVQVEKYIPCLVPVNVYIPRYFAISAKASDEVKYSVRYVNLSKEQTDTLMKELNPHLNELKKFNDTQLIKMDHYIKESEIQAKNHGLEPPHPQLVVYDLDGNKQVQNYSNFYYIKKKNCL